MEKNEAVGSVHLAISHLASALHGISVADLTHTEPLAIELGDDKVFVLDNGLVICKPDRLMGLDPRLLGDRTASIKILPYPSLPEHEGRSSGSGQHESPGPTPK